MVSRRGTRQFHYDDPTIQMLDSIDFSDKLKLQSDGSENLAEDHIQKALSASLQKKSKKIDAFLQANGNNLRKHLHQLYGFATSHDGLMKDEYREKIWPILAEYIPFAPKLCRDNNSRKKANSRATSDNEASCSEDQDDSDFESALSSFDESDERDTSDNDLDNENTLEPSIEELRKHREWNQVELDVNRTLARFPPNISDDEREHLQHDLTPLIVRLLWENPGFSYYQGFHDICLTLILVMGSRQALKAAKILTRRASFYNYLTYTLEETALAELQNVYVLLYLYDPDVEQHMRNAELGTLFGLSWLLTWFSHIVILFDLFLSSHHMMPVYVGAALIYERRDEVLKAEQEMPILHQLLNTVPSNVNVNKIIDTARILFERFPPPLVQGEFRKAYEGMCIRQQDRKQKVAKLQQMIPRQQAVQPLPRHNLLQWVMSHPLEAAGAVAGIAITAYLTKNLGTQF
ncbi:rab-GTPase-TBC domain-containing protein [Ditylenchus destructor]|nr:rab-GTPase-TBC domain-containing protein [Ditylenchus destructor]